jgi:hypothetical protein
LLPPAHADANSLFGAGFAVVLSDDALQLARHRPPIELATGWSCLPYLFGVAIYCFEVCNSLEMSHRAHA